MQPTQEPKENISGQNYYQNYYPQPLPEHSNVQPVQATDEIIFDHNVIFFVDSNLKQMKADIMDRNSTCVLFYTPTLKHISNVLNRANIKQQLRKILINCGTTHLYNNTNTTEQLENEYISILEKVQELLPAAEVFVSSLMQRKEANPNKLVKIFNDFLYSVSCTATNVRLIRNNNIKRNMLVDPKHVNKEGFLTLLSNIKYMIFGKILQFKRQNRIT